MPACRPIWRSAILAWLAAAGLQAQTAAVERTACEQLAACGVPFDTNRVQILWLEALARTCDPGAALVTAPDAVAPTGAPVHVEHWPEQITYVRPAALAAATVAPVAAALAGGSDSNATGVVLDLRNAGGDAYAAIGRLAASMVVTGTPLFTLAALVGTNDERVVQAEGAGVTGRCAALMVIVNRDTREAAEALAACLKGRPRVMLLGEPTRGESAVRTVVEPAPGVAIRVATHRVRMADGRDYAGTGVPPDIAVQPGSPSAVVLDNPAGWHRHPLSERALRDVQLGRRVAPDAALQRAVDILLGLRAVRSAHGD